MITGGLEQNYQDNVAKNKSNRKEFHFIRKNDKIYMSKNLVIIMSLPVLHLVGEKLAQKRYSTPNTLNYYSLFYFLNVFIDDDKY